MTHYELHAERCAPAQMTTERSAFTFVVKGFCAALRTALFGIESLLQKPFAALVMMLSVWGAAHAGLSMSQQSKKHPAPLFQTQGFALAAKADIVKPDMMKSDMIRAELARPFKASAPAAPPASDVALRDVQAELMRRGFLKSAADGKAGPLTVAAIRAFQDSAGVPVDGVASAGLLTLLKSDAQDRAVSTVDPILVFSVQRRLNQLGYTAGAENGELSQPTRRAILAFERDAGLAPTGLITTALLQTITARTATVAASAR